MGNFLTKSGVHYLIGLIKESMADMNSMLTNAMADMNSTLTNAIIPKADKVADATNGNLAALDASGNLIDSGKKPSDFAADLAVPVTYSELKTLRDGGNLVTGTWYRITDYECTTSQADTQSAGHNFDILVQAIGENYLSEEAKACRQSSGPSTWTDMGVWNDNNEWGAVSDTYFENSKLEAWELKYCIDNDTDRFGWADSSNGKGVIYWMKDEFGNEAGYDFKNIMMKFYKITAVTTVPSSLRNTYSVSKMVGGTAYTITSGCTVSDSDTESRYTFDLFTDNTHYDYSLNTYGNFSSKLCHGNIIPALFGITGSFGGNEGSKLQYINFISFRNTSNSNKCYGNIFGSRCYNLSLGNACYSNKFGNDCFSNTFGNECYSNKFGNACYSNTFGIGCYSNKFGNACYSNTFGDLCCNNTLGIGCYSNTFGGSYQYNTFGNNCGSNTFGGSCYRNIFGNNCGYNTFGGSCQRNTFGNNCQSNTFGKNCSRNTFEGDCNSNTFGNYCYNNTFGNGCQYIKFGNSSSAKSYYEGIIIENLNQYIYLDTTQTTSSSNKIRNVKIAQGVNNTTTYKTISHNTVNDTFQTTYQPASSQVILI